MLISTRSVLAAFCLVGCALSGCGGAVAPEASEEAPTVDGGALPCPLGFGEWYGGLCAASMPESECPATAIYTKGLCAVKRSPSP